MTMTIKEVLEILYEDYGVSKSCQKGLIYHKFI